MNDKEKKVASSQMAITPPPKPPKETMRLAYREVIEIDVVCPAFQRDRPNAFRRERKREITGETAVTQTTDSYRARNLLATRGQRAVKD